MNETLAIQTAVEGLIEAAEGFKDTAYWDVDGWAIGYGNHDYQDGTAVQQGDTINQADAETLVNKVAAQKWQAIKPCITASINENQGAALIDLAYNCGEGFVCHSTLLQLINAGAPADQVTAQFEQTCVTAKGTYLSDLYHRRVNEVNLFFTSVTQYVQQNSTQVILVGGVLIAALTGYLVYRVYFKKGR